MIERIETSGRNGPPAAVAVAMREREPARHPMGDLRGGFAGGFVGGAVSMGVLVLDRGQRVTYANREATRLLASSGVVHVDAAGHVRCRAREADRRFRRMAEAVHAADPPRGPATLTLAREDRLPVVVQVAAEPVSLASPAGEGGGTLILMRDAEHEPLCAPELLQAVFGLTEAEAGVVARLAAGQDAGTIASERGVSIVTVRNQVKAALSKVGVGRQAELVSVALRVARL